jgi:hypothetical protein
LLFSFLFQKRTVCLFDGRHGWKNHNEFKRTAPKIVKEEALAHRKRPRSAISREGMLELQQ